MSGIPLTTHVNRRHVLDEPRRRSPASELTASCRADIDHHRRRTVGNTRSSMYTHVYETILAAYADAASTQIVSITDTRSRNDWRAHTRLSAGSGTRIPVLQLSRRPYGPPMPCRTFHEAGHIRHRRNFHHGHSLLEHVRSVTGRDDVRPAIPWLRPATIPVVVR